MPESIDKNADAIHVRESEEPQPVQANWDGLALTFHQTEGRTAEVCKIAHPSTGSQQTPQQTLIVCLKGSQSQLSVTLSGHGNAVYLGPGDLCLVPSNGSATFECSKGRATYAKFVISHDARVDLPNGAHTTLNTLAARPAQYDEFVYRSTLQLIEWLPQGDELTRMMCEQLQRLLRLHLFKYYRDGADASAPGNRHHQQATARMQQQIVHYIKSSLDQPLRLTDLARAIDLSTHQLQLFFKQQFGTTPMQYVTRIRLEHARHLLLHTNHDIAHIAGDCGFSSHSHLSAVFKNATGLTPNQLRRRGGDGSAKR